jgi:hypothetical protein
MKEAQFINVRFETEKQFEEWLMDKTEFVITLRDHRQDMQKLWVHETGEILCTDFSQRLYVGKFLNVEEFGKGNLLQIWDEKNSKWWRYLSLEIEKIQTVKELVVKEYIHFQRKEKQYVTANGTVLPVEFILNHQHKISGNRGYVVMGESKKRVII